MKLLATLATVAAASAAAGIAMANDPVRDLPDVAPRGSTMLESVGIATRDLQPAAVTPDGATLYTAKRDGVVCVTDRLGTGHCAPVDGLEDGLGFGGELCRPGLPADQTRVTAIVPDAVRTVRLERGDQTIAEQAVSDGVVGFEISRTEAQHGLAAVLETDAGVRTVKVPSPPIGPEAPCDPDM